MRFTCGKQGTNFFAAQDGTDDTVLIAACNHHCYPGVLGNLCGFHLGLHTACSLRRAGTAGNSLNLRRDLRNLGDEPCRRICARVCRIDTVNIRKDDKRIRINKCGDDSRQIIIVPDLDLVDGNSIIFIDDGDDIHPKECEERIA